MLNRTPRLAAALVSATLLASLAVSTVSAAAPIHGNGHGPGHGPELDRELAAVRAATQRFQDPNEAVKAGYGLPPAPAPLHECISSFDDTGAMGFHYINGNLLDTTVDALQPEALVYAPDSAGQAPPGRPRIRRLPGALDRRARHQEDAVAVPPDVHVDRRTQPLRASRPSSRSTCGCTRTIRPGCSSRSTRTCPAARLPRAPVRLDWPPRRQPLHSIARSIAPDR